MAVTIGHACIDERGKAHGGSAGDQTKKEVYSRTWYSKPWHTVFRPKSSDVAEKIAKAMEQACANNNIGYDQYQRTTLFTKAKAEKWDISKITEKCETDCSALVAVCCNAAGVTVSKDMYTGNEKSLLTKTGAFTVYTASKYTDSSANLKRGDILLGNGHTAVVLSNGSNIKTAAYFKRYTGNSNSLVDALKSIGATSTFAYRTKIAKANAIKGYIGTPSQNTKLLNLLRKGKLIKP